MARSCTRPYSIFRGWAPSISMHPCCRNTGGPAPIQWAIINGEKRDRGDRHAHGRRTGYRRHSSDGKKTPIEPDDTSGTLHDRLSEMGAIVLLKTLEQFETKDIRPVPQDHTLATYAPLLRKKRRSYQLDPKCRNHRMHDPGDGSLARCLYLSGRQTPQNFQGTNGARRSACRLSGGHLRERFSKVFRTNFGWPPERAPLSISELQGASGKRP